MMMVARDRFFDEEPLVALALLAKALTEYLYGPIFGDGGTAEVEGQSGARQAGEGHEVRRTRDTMHWSGCMRRGGR